MLLNLKKIINSAGLIPFDVSLDLSDLVFGNCKPVSEPVHAYGSVSNTAGVLTLTGTIETTIHGVCDRCAKPFERDILYPVDAILTEKLETEEDADIWTFLLDNQCADLTDIITTAFVLNMDSQLLCRKDCAGLCFRCGKDLNEGPCDCQPEVDPRLAVLKQLLKGN